MIKSAIILAAGKGTRMVSEKPKTLHRVAGRPMVLHVLDAVKLAGASKVVTVIGHGKEKMEEVLAGQCELAVQQPQLGTAHAVMCATQCENDEGITLICYGDSPCFSVDTYKMIYEQISDCDAVVLTALVKEANRYGRIVRDRNGHIEKIVEYKDCNEQQRAIEEINTGIYAFKTELLFKYIKEVKDYNAQREYYLTDLVEIFNSHGLKVKAVSLKDNQEMIGVNDRVDLAKANKFLYEKICEKWMRKGVTIMDPATTYIGYDVTIGEDTTIYPGCFLTGKTMIGKGNTLLMNCYIEDSVIGDYNSIDNARIIQSEVKNHCQIGPFVHLRMHSIVEDCNRIGNFVEFKNTHFGYDSRCAHLTYLGDSDVGKNVNIGCGVVTVNYDGKNKFHTTIKDGSFIGSNVNLIAPITVGEKAVCAAGSTINQDVADGQMAIARERQTNKDDFGYHYLNKEKK